MRTPDAMPRYDFRCESCGAAFEKRLSMSAYSDGEGRECTECGSEEVERTFSAVSVIAGPGRSAEAEACIPRSGFT